MKLRRIAKAIFLGRIIKWITNETDYNFVLSYSDMTQGHKGTIYKASNFREIGKTAATKYVDWKGTIYHPRSLSIDRDYSYRMREAVITGEAVIKVGLPKIIWLYDIKRKHRSEKQQRPKVMRTLGYKTNLEKYL